MLILYHFGTDEVEIGFSYLKKTKTEVVSPGFLVPDKLHLWYQPDKRDFLAGIKMHVAPIGYKILRHLMLINVAAGHLPYRCKSL